MYDVTYYDDYNFNFDNSYVDDYTYQATPSLGMTYNTGTFSSNHPASNLHLFNRGRQTRSKTGILKQDLSVPTVYVNSYMFYDKFGRALQTVTEHSYTGADVDWIKYNFPGWVMARSREH